MGTSIYGKKLSNPPLACITAKTILMMLGIPPATVHMSILELNAFPSFFFKQRNLQNII